MDFRLSIVDVWNFSVRSLCSLCLGGDEVSLLRSHREHGDSTARINVSSISDYRGGAENAEVTQRNR